MSLALVLETKVQYILQSYVEPYLVKTLNETSSIYKVYK